MLTTVLAGAVMAISFSAPPGPVTMETVRRGLRGGFRPALLVQLGSIIGDVAWCALALLGLAPLVQLASVRVLLAVAGVAVLLYLGAAGVREAFRARGAGLVLAAPAGDARSAFRSGMAISLANPMAVGYWLSVGGALVAAGVAGASLPQTSAFMLGFIGGTLAWAFIMALAVRWSRVLVTPAVHRWVHFACGAALMAFGLSLALRMFSPLL
jgi:chemosensory pili system protein ChpE